MTINKTRPQYYPLHATLGLGTVLPQDSQFIYASYKPGQPVPSGDHNGKLNSNGQWASYNDATIVRVQDWLDTASTAALTLTSLTYVNGGNVTGSGAVVSTRGVYLFNGGRLETDDAFLNPVGALVSASPLVFPTATLPGRIWLYASELGELRVESVGPVTLDAPLVGEMTLIGLEVDALGVVTNGALAPTTVPLPASPSLPVAIDIISAANIACVIAVPQQLDVLGGLGGAPSMTVGPTTGENSVVITGNGVQTAMTFTSTASGCISTTATGATACVSATPTGAGDGFRALPFGAGRGLSVEHSGTGDGISVDMTSGTGTGIDVIGSLTGIGINVTTSIGTGILCTATGSGNALSCVGGNSAASLAGRFEASHASAYALSALTSTGAVSTVAALLGTGRGAGAGVEATALGTGYGLVVSADTTTPTRAAMRLVPQDADPTTPLQGDFLFQSGRGSSGKFRGRTLGQWESMHSSAKGHVFAFGLAASGGPLGGGSGNLSLAAINPEQVGDVLVLGTGSLEFSVDNGACTVSLVDATSAVTIATQVERAIDTDGVAPNVRSFAIQGIRTLPNTLNRSFAVVITASTGSINYTNVITRVDGLQ